MCVLARHSAARRPADSMWRARCCGRNTSGRRGHAYGHGHALQQRWLPRRRSTRAICNYGLQGCLRGCWPRPRLKGHLGNRRRRLQGTLAVIKRASIKPPYSPVLTHSARSHIHSLPHSSPQALRPVYLLLSVSPAWRVGVFLFASHTLVVDAPSLLRSQCGSVPSLHPAPRLTDTPARKYIPPLCSRPASAWASAGRLLCVAASRHLLLVKRLLAARDAGRPCRHHFHLNLITPDYLPL